MERRTSPRTKTNIIVTARHQDVSYRLRCSELSQTGLLMHVPSALRKSQWPYLRATLELGMGPVHLLARRVSVRGTQIGYSFIVLDDASEERLTDFLFECMYEQEVGARVRRRRSAARPLKQAAAR